MDLALPPFVSCEEVVDNKEYFRAASGTVFAASLLLRVVASIVDTDDMTAKGPIPGKLGRPLPGPKLPGEYNVGIHGYAQLTITRPDPEKRKKRIANGLNTAAQIGQWLAGAAFGRLLSCQTQLNDAAMMEAILNQSCEPVGSHEAILANQEQILRNQEALLALPALRARRR